jgi:oligoribonuclease
MPLAGRSVHFDRAFLQAQKPEALIPCTHRNFDMSTLAAFASSIGKETYPRTEVHRAMDDVLDSIDEACFYKEMFS